MEAIKEQAIKVIENLPSQVTMDEIMAELYFKMQVDAGLKELDEAKGISHEEVKKRMDKWIGS